MTNQIISRSWQTLAVALVSTAALFAFAQTASAVQSPPGCTADNSVVNISSDVALAEEGDIITFTVEAGNPASGDGCDIEDREITLTLPDGTTSSVGPDNYPNPTALSDVITEQYVADLADLDGGVWDATVEWNGILRSVSNQPSNGDKGVSVFPIYPLEIEKTVDTSYDREWTWEIEKVVDEDDLILAEGETYTVNYDVTVTPSSNDTNHTVSGIITITNPADNPTATIEDVTDVLDSTGAITVDCTYDGDFTGFPYDLDEGDTLECSYSGASNGNDEENEATVETSGDVPGDSTVEPVSFGDPDNEIDECVDVNDDQFGPLGQVCADDSDKTLEYDWTFGPADGQDIDTIVECNDDFDHPNIADFITNDNSETGEDDAVVHVRVDCFVGCTLTQGYWKTHSMSGPAPYDDNWQSVGPDEEEETFFLSGDTWFNVFWTPPKGSAYYQLAHQWMAAWLNVENGASTPGDVADAIADGESLFNTYAPDDLITFALNKKGKPTGKKEILEPEVLDEMKDLASILGSYNEGDIGPGHCDEQNPDTD